MPRGAARHRRQQIEALNRRVVEGQVLEMDHDADGADVRMAGEGFQAMAQDRLAG